MFRHWKKIIPHLLATTVLLILVFLVYKQTSNWSIQHWKTIHIHHPILLLAVFLLSLFNWGIEFWKWETIVRFTGFQTTQKQRWYAYLAGISSGFVTPNFIGNFIGRIYHFPRIQRPYILVFTLFSNASQFFASILFGLFAWWLVGTEQTALPKFPSYFIWISSGVIVLFLFAYLGINQVSILPRKWRRFNRYLKKTRLLRFYLLIQSLIRHVVFSGQFVLLLAVFGFPVDGETWFWVWQVFFWSTWTPSLWFGKLVIRESFALLILAEIYGKPEIILTVSLLLWLINQALPACVGWFGWWKIIKK